MSEFLALLGLGIDSKPAVKGAKEFEDAADRATRAGGKAADTTEKWSGANEKQGRSARNAAKATKEVETAAIGAAAAGDKATAAAERQFGAYERLVRGGRAVAAALAVTIAAYAATIGVAAAESMRFETGLTGVGKTANLEGKALEQLGARIDTLARDTLPAASDQLLGIAQSAGQLGVSGTENLLAFTETITKLGAASDLVGEEGATALARILNVTGEGASKVGTLASVIVALGNNFAATESQIARHAGEVARATAVYEIGSAQAAAIATTLAAFGVQAELSGSAVGRAFRVIESAVKSGGEEMADLSAVSRASAEEFKAAWERGPVDALKLFLGGIRETAAEGGNVAAQLERLGLSGEETLKVIPVLAKEMSTLDRALAIAAAQTANATALDEEFERAMATTAAQAALLRNEVSSFIRVAGDELLPGINSVISGLKGWFAENRGLATSVGELGSSLIEMAGAAGGALSSALGKLAEHLDLVTAGIVAAGAAWLVWSASWQVTIPLLLNGLARVLYGIQAVNAALVKATALTATANPWGLAAVAVGVLAGSLVLAHQKYEDDQRLMAAGAAATERWGGSLDDARDHVESFGSGLEGASAAIQAATADLDAMTAAQDALAAAAERASRAGQFSPGRIGESARIASEADQMGAAVDRQRQIIAELREEEAFAAAERAAYTEITKLWAEEERKANAAAEEAARLSKQQQERLQGATEALREQIFQIELLARANGLGAEAEEAAARSIAVRNAAIQAGLAPGALAAEVVEQLAGKLFDLQKQIEKTAKAEQLAHESALQRAERLERESRANATAEAELIDMGKARGIAIEAMEREADHEEALLEARSRGQVALREYLIQYEVMKRALAANVVGAEDEEENIERITAAVRRLFEVVEKGAAEDKVDAAALANAETIVGAYEDAANHIVGDFAGMAGDFLRGSEVTWSDLWGSFRDAAAGTFEQVLRDWIATKLRMEAAEATINIAGGGNGGGIGAGQVGSAAGATGASAGTLAVLGVFAVAVLAWRNDYEHRYKMMLDTIDDLSAVMKQVSDTIGEYISPGSSGIAVRNDGDRFRVRSGTDEGKAEWKYFDEYADAIAGATLDRLRQLLDQGRLDHVGEQAKLVFGQITDEIIMMGEAGIAWIQKGLTLAAKLDNAGKSQMELDLDAIDREYEENIRLADEYGLSLSKVGDYYRQQLSDIEQSLRDRIAQYKPGYDPIGAEFDRLRADNEALKAHYEKQRADLQEHIEQVMRNIERLATGGGGSGPPGVGNIFNQIDLLMEQLMNAEISIGSGSSVLIIEQISDLMAQLDAIGNVATGGGGLTPDAAARLAEQRALLEELMRQLGLIGEGLTDEEIDAAEREARRRQNRGNRGNERASYEDTLRSIVASGLPDLVRELRATEDQIAEVAAQAAKLGVNGDLATAALEVLNQQLQTQAQDAYLTLAEKMADALGDEEALRDLARLRWELERAEMTLQIEMLAESGRLTEEQIENLRRLNERYGALDPTAPVPEDPGDVAGGVLSGMGIDIDGLLAQVDAMRQAATMVQALANGAKVAIPGLSELRKKIAEMDDEARKFVGDQLFLSFGDRMLSFIERYYGQTEEGEALRVALETARFHIELQNLNAQFEMLKALGVLTDEQIRIINAAMGVLNDPENWPDFSVPTVPAYTAPQSSGSSADERAAELERFFEALARWEQLGLSDARRELMDLREEFDDLRATAIRLGQSVGRVDAAYQIAMADFWDRALSPYEDRAETASERLQAIQDHFSELIDLAGEYEGDLERILAAQQQAVADLWEEILGPLRDYQSQLAGSALGAATPEERLLAAQADFQRLADAALSGDVNAIQQLPAAIEALLREAQGYYGTGAAYQALYTSIQSIIDQILGLGGMAGTGAGGVDIGSDRDPRIPAGIPAPALGNVTSFATRMPLIPQVQSAASFGESESTRLLRAQLEEQKKINREQARIQTELLAEMRRTREETAQMRQELMALAQVQRRTNTAIEDEARTRKTVRRGAA